MATVAQFRIPAADVALESTFQVAPSLSCELEQSIVADEPAIWLRGANQPTINAALVSDRTVVRFSVVTGDANRWLYTVRFTQPLSDLFSIVVEHGGTLLSAQAKDATWFFSVRVPTRDDASRVYDRFTAHNGSTELERIYELTGASVDETGLTDDQHEALSAAIRHGYFEIPREITLKELSDVLDISHQALSERLRRAYRTLATTELHLDADVGWPPEPQGE